MDMNLVVLSGKVPKESIIYKAKKRLLKFKMDVTSTNGTMNQYNIVSFGEKSMLGHNILKKTKMLTVQGRLSKDSKKMGEPIEVVATVFSSAEMEGEF